MNYEVQMGKSDSSKPGLEKFKTSTDITFSILNKEGKYRECSWKHGHTTLVGMDESEIDAKSIGILNLNEGMNVKMFIDEYGVFQEISNFLDCQLFTENLSNSFIGLTSKDMDPDSEHSRKTFDLLSTTYSTPEIFLATYCPELNLLFDLFGRSFNVDSSYMSTSYCPNPFGGRNLPTELIMMVEAIENNIAQISVSADFVEEDFKEIMMETFRESARINGEPFDESEIPELHMTTKSTYWFDTKHNILEEVFFEKLMDADGINQTQTIRIMLKK